MLLAQTFHRRSAPSDWPSSRPLRCCPACLPGAGVGTTAAAELARRQSLRPKNRPSPGSSAFGVFRFGGSATASRARHGERDPGCSSTCAPRAAASCRRPWSVLMCSRHRWRRHRRSQGRRAPRGEWGRRKSAPAVGNNARSTSRWIRVRFVRPTPSPRCASTRHCSEDGAATCRPSPSFAHRFDPSSSIPPLRQEPFGGVVDLVPTTPLFKPALLATEGRHPDLAAITSPAWIARTGSAAQAQRPQRQAVRLREAEWIKFLRRTLPAATTTRR